MHKLLIMFNSLLKKKKKKLVDLLNCLVDYNVIFCTIDRELLSVTPWSFSVFL